MKILIENLFSFHYEIIETIINKYDMLFNIVKKNDIIILASDGLWDNLFIKEIMSIVSELYSNIKEKNDVFIEIIGLK